MFLLRISGKKKNLILQELVTAIKMMILNYLHISFFFHNASVPRYISYSCWHFRLYPEMDSIYLPRWNVSRRLILSSMDHSWAHMVWKRPFEEDCLPETG